MWSCRERLQSFSQGSSSRNTPPEPPPEELCTRLSCTLYKGFVYFVQGCLYKPTIQGNTHHLRGFTMEQVSTGEFRKRIPFWLAHLPIELTNNGTVVAVIHPPTPAVEVEAPATLDPIDEKQKKIEALRALVQTIETKTPAAEAEETAEEEVRLYTEPTDAGEISLRVTWAGLLKKHGRRQAQIFWRQAQPIQP